MRTALLVGILVVTAACGAYHFPGPGNQTGNVHGHVVALGCGGPIQPDARPCAAKPTSACPLQPTDQTCGRWPLPTFDLTFTNGSTRQIAKTDSAGAYSIDLPAGTWQVGTTTFGRIVDGPQTVVVTAGADIVADYVVDTGIRAAA